jgi:hypothetical protein
MHDDEVGAVRTADVSDEGSVPRTERVAELEQQSATATRLFDVRMVIGGLFVLYGALIGAAGAFATDADIRKAQGVNINLWTGVAMLLLGLLFLLWLKLRPLGPPETGSSAAEAHPGGDDR